MTYPKAVLIGESNVGKTCLFEKFQRKLFQPNLPGTVGSVFETITIHVNGQKIDVGFFDTAGQEKYRDIVPIYFRGASFILLVYSITDQPSFDQIKLWVDLAKMYSVCPIILLGNKCDDEKNRAVSYSKGEEMKKMIGASQFFEVSALNGTNINDLLYYIGEGVLQENPGSHRFPFHVLEDDIGDSKNDSKSFSKCCK
jgi:small GTP-binding protein